MKKAKKKGAKAKPAIRFRQTLFWDVNVNKIDPSKHARYIIERIMDFGTDDEVRWMWQTYDRSLIRDVVKRSRVLHKQTRALWTLMTSRG